MARRRRIDPGEGERAVSAWRAQDAVARPVLATAVRFALEELAERAPGGAVEVRVPPFGVTQCIGGLQHRRGTPPNVVELDPRTWLELATGSLTWADAVAAGRVSASGSRADLASHLPLFVRSSG